MIKMMKKLFSSRKESKMDNNVNFAFGKVDLWVKEKANSAKVLTLAELEEMQERRGGIIPPLLFFYFFKT